MNEQGYPKVLVVGPADSLGGIAAVLRVHRTMPLWSLANCRILSTFDERNTFTKLKAMLRAYVLAPVLIARSTLVHIHLAAQHSMLRKLPIALLTKVMRKPFVIHLHAASEESVFISTPQWLVRALFLLSYRVIVLSNSWAAIVKAHLPDTRVTIIQNPVITCQPCNGRPSVKSMVLFAGKLEPRKGFMELLHAVPKVLAKYPNATFCFAGHGDIERARIETQHLGIEGSVSFVGWLSPQDISIKFQQASIFCLPSFDEGLPMSVLEAMSHQLPVVCTPVGGLPGLISHGHDGLFVEPGNSDAIADAVLTLLSNPERAAQVGKNAVATVQRECGIERVERELSNLYREVNEEWMLRRRGIPESLRPDVNPVQSTRE